MTACSMPWHARVEAVERLADDDLRRVDAARRRADDRVAADVLERRRLLRHRQRRGRRRQRRRTVDERPERRWWTTPRAVSQRRRIDAPIACAAAAISSSRATAPARWPSGPSDVVPSLPPAPWPPYHARFSSACSTRTARPVDVELLGDHHRQARLDALAHVGILRPQHDACRRDRSARSRSA